MPCYNPDSMWLEKSAGTTGYVPDYLSPTMQNIIAAKNEVWKIKPQTKEDWKKFSDIFYESGSQNVKNLIEYYKVEITDETINNVPCYWVRPNGKYDKDKVLIFLHGGGYVFGYGKSSLTESVYMAWVNGYQVLAIDYRMASEYPYPAAVDDALAVYKEILKKFDNKKIGVFGTSTGGGMTLILTQMAKDNKLPLPAAIAPLTPWTDVAKIGDSYYTKRWITH